MNAKRLYGYGKNRTDFYGLAKELKAHSEWVMGNMRAGYGLPTLGQLPIEFHTSALYSTYVVYSWETPIAWIDARTGKWVMPDVEYSQTTTQHQGRIAVALSVMDKV